MAAEGDSGVPVSACGSSSLRSGENTKIKRSAISADGSKIFFVAPNPDGYQDVSCFEPKQLYVRNGDHVVRISRSRRTTPDTQSDAFFGAAAADGSKVYFLSDEALTDDADPAKDGLLYEYETGTDALHLLTPAGGVSYVVDASADGSHVYYTRGDDLLSFADGQERKIATLSGTHDQQGGGPEIGLWNVGSGPLQIARDGSWAVLRSYANLTAYDSGGRAELFKVTESDGSTVCVSCRPDGTVATSGSDFLSSANSSAFTPGNVTADGRFIAFDTKDRLVPEDTTGQQDVYLWHDGKLSLMSDGRSKTGSYFFGMDTSDAHDVVFATTSPLVSSGCRRRLAGPLCGDGRWWVS